MKDKSVSFWVILGISVLLAFVVFFYARYSNQELTDPAMFGLQQKQEVFVENVVENDTKVEKNQIEEDFV